MKLGRRWGQIPYDSCIHVQCGTCDIVHKRFDLLAKRLQMTRQNGGVDLLQGFVSWKCHVEDAKQRNEAGIHFIASSARLQEDKRTLKRYQLCCSSPYTGGELNYKIVISEMRNRRI